MTITTTDNRSVAALHYANQGLRIIPLHGVTQAGHCTCKKGTGCPDKGKHPRITDWPNAASSDPYAVQSWFIKWPNSNIGALTGEGLFVVDEDNKNGKDGKATRLHLESEHSPFSHALTTVTPSGGAHYWLRAPEGVKINSDDNVLGEGLDIKGEGGYVVMPPSRTHVGQYRTADRVDFKKLPMAPGWMVKRVQKQDRPALQITGDGYLAEPTDGVEEKVLQRALDRLQNGEPRNSTGFWMACQLRDNRVDFRTALGIAHTYADTVSGLGDHEYTRAEAEKSLAQAYENGEPREPWQPRAYTFEDFKRDLESTAGEKREALVIDLIDKAATFPEPELRKAKMLVRVMVSAGAARDWIGAVRVAQEEIQGARFTADRLASLIAEEERFARDVGGKLYRYLHGVYLDDGEAFIHRKVKEILGEKGASDQWSSKLQDEVVKYILVDAPELWERPPVGVLNVKNGLYHVSTKELHPHTPDHLSSVQFPVVYDQSATCDEIDKWVADTLDADNVNLPAEVVAWILMVDNPADQALMLRGAGGNGKSILLAIFTALLGKNNVSAVSLQKLTSSRFAANRLVGKVANICPDLPSGHLTETDIFKRITGGDPVNTEYKHGKDFDFNAFCKLIFSANETPTSSDTSDAYFRRWVVVPFNKKFDGSERIKRAVLLRKLTTPAQLSGLLNKALDRWGDVSEKGLSVSDSMHGAQLQFMEQSSPITTWLSEYVVRDPDNAVECAALMEAYKAFAREQRHPIPSAKEFGNKVRQFHRTVQVVLRVPHGRIASPTRTKHYAGLRLSEDFGEVEADTDDTVTSNYRREERDDNRAGEGKREAVETEDAGSIGYNGITMEEEAPF